MITPKFFFDILNEKGVNFFCGVPDSLLKDFCAYVTDNTIKDFHVITANEGAAIGLAAGYHIATNNYPLVYMQNSGLGNSVNPLLSLADPEVYSLPMIMLIGWRGEPGVKDEPQHVKQGKVTLEILDAMGINYAILTDNHDEVIKQVDTCITYIKTNNAPYAFVVKKGIFEEYKLKNQQISQNVFSREEAIQFVVNNLGVTDIVVSTTGMISRELYEYREKLQQGHEKDFLTVGSMGHASQIALGIAMQKKDRKVICLDGDGATLMHMGSLGIIGNIAPNNYIHIVLNNGAHDSVGGQPTVGLNVDFQNIALACGYKKVFKVNNGIEINEAFNIAVGGGGPVLIEIIVKKGARIDLGRPKSTPIQNKLSLMKFVNQ